MHQIPQNIKVVSGAQVAIETSKLQIIFPRHNTRLYKDAYKSLIKRNKFHTRGKINEMENLRKTKAAQTAQYLLKIMEVVGLERDLALGGLPYNGATATQDGVDVRRTCTEPAAREVVPSRHAAQQHPCSYVLRHRTTSQRWIGGGLL
jgi:hypothetical protein